MMQMSHISLLAVVALLLFTSNVMAQRPVCYSNGYCQYTGTVKKLYVNNQNLILLYFDTAFDPQEAGVAGYSVSVGAAAAVSLTENPEFAKLFYSTALSAQATGRRVTVQMRGKIGGYLKIDRIWINE